jgi:hypothetical protein
MQNKIGIVIGIKKMNSFDFNVVMYEVLIEGYHHLVLESWLNGIDL